MQNNAYDRQEELVKRHAYCIKQTGRFEYKPDATRDTMLTEDEFYEMLAKEKLHAGKIEIRTYYQGTGTLRVNKITIKRLL